MLYFQNWEIVLARVFRNMLDIEKIGEVWCRSIDF